MPRRRRKLSAKTTTSEICGVQDHGCAAQLVGGLRSLPDSIQWCLRSHLRKAEAERACAVVQAAVRDWDEMHEMFHVGLSEEEMAEFWDTGAAAFAEGDRMPEAKIVFVVTSGSYSDYGINAMFSTRELAQAYIDKARQVKEGDPDYDICGIYWVGDDVSIEEWEIDSQHNAEVVTCWSCGMLLDDGSVVEGPHERREFESSTKKSYVSQYDVKVPAFKDRPIVRVVSYKSADHALKLAAEQRQKWLREGEICQKKK